MQEFITDERMFQAGMLRIVMKMRKESKGFDACFDAVASELRLEPLKFRAYVTGHMPEMMASVKTQGKRVYWEL